MIQYKLSEAQKWARVDKTLSTMLNRKNKGLKPCVNDYEEYILFHFAWNSKASRIGKR